MAEVRKVGKQQGTIGLDEDIDLFGALERPPTPGGFYNVLISWQLSRCLAKRFDSIGVRRGTRFRELELGCGPHTTGVPAEGFSVRNGNAAGERMRIGVQPFWGVTVEAAR